MSYKTEFPDFDYELPNLGAGWFDDSWHNDICPSLDYKLNDQDKVVRIWFDYANPALREISDKQYVLAMGVYGESLDHVMASDNLSEILAYIKDNDLLAEGKQ